MTRPHAPAQNKTWTRGSDMPARHPAKTDDATVADTPQDQADWDEFLHHVKHEITDLADELLLALSCNPSVEIDADLASLMRSMDELLHLYQARGEAERAEFAQLQDADARSVK
jgi:hypothetical protein